MMSQTGLDAEQADFINYIRTSGQALLALTNDILDFSKIEANKLDLEYNEFDINRIVNDTVKIQKMFASAKNIEIYSEIDPAIDFLILSDPNRLRQILINLANNAVKFTEKGKINIKVKAENIAGEDALIKISVIDEGIGIPEDRIENLFKRFNQVHDPTLVKLEGAGLGLAIADQLVRLLGGEGIKVDSRPGVGSDFNFLINFKKGGKRVIESSENSFGDQAVSITGAVRRLKILLAEDNRLNTVLATKILNRMGHDVIPVTNGRDAVEAAMREKFDLIILDVQMPVLNGLDAARELRRASNETPVVALTAAAMKGDREKCEAAGMNAYLTKPLSPQDLAAAIARLINNAENKGPVKISGGETKIMPAGGPMTLNYVKLKQCMGGIDELMEDAANLFIDSFNENLTDLTAEISRGNIDKIRRAAHKFKGSALSAFAESIAGVLLCIESSPDKTNAAALTAETRKLPEMFELYIEEARRTGLKK